MAITKKNVFRQQSVFKSSRREALRSLSGLGLCIGSTALVACSGDSGDSGDAVVTGDAIVDENTASLPEPISNYGPLRDPDVNGIQLPEGFTSRIVAYTGQKPIETSDYLWHGAPDGGAVFADGDGWIYLSNAELDVNGGVGALRFDSEGNIVSAYPVLTGTLRNCAGGAMPWGTWLSCEEVPFGGVWECHPNGQPARSLPALGRF